jgi:hypothetical protein
VVTPREIGYINTKPEYRSARRDHHRGRVKISREKRRADRRGCRFAYIDRSIAGETWILWPLLNRRRQPERDRVTGSSHDYFQSFWGRMNACYQHYL